MLKDDHLFVYGTLMSTERMSLTESRFRFGVAKVGEDAINGQLYDLGSFPGVQLPEGVLPEFDPDKPYVVGEVYQIKGHGVVGEIDNYEGYPSLYNRMQVPTANGRRAWVYVFNGRVDPGRLIASGDWRARNAA